MSDIFIILAEENELASLKEIEQRAGKRFAAYGLEDVMTASTTPVEALLEGFLTRTLWVAKIAPEQIVGFVLAGWKDGHVHLKELDVLPEYGQQGIGRALVQTVLDWARRQYSRMVTLTTMRSIPWNGPFYQKLGFVEQRMNDLSEEMQMLLAEEIASGLPGEDRIVMCVQLY